MALPPHPTPVCEMGSCTNGGKERKGGWVKWVTKDARHRGNAIGVGSPGAGGQGTTQWRAPPLGTPRSNGCERASPQADKLPSAMEALNVKWDNQTHGSHFLFSSGVVSGGHHGCSVAGCLLSAPASCSIRARDTVAINEPAWLELEGTL